MIVPIAEYPFKGLHKTIGKLEDKPGVFTIISEFDGINHLFDVDCSETVKKKIENHERRKCWEKYRKGLIRYAVLYESDFPFVPKEKLVEEVRKRYKTVPCGARADTLPMQSTISPHQLCVIPS